MSVIDNFKRAFHNWRRKTFPPSVADIEWRHDAIMADIAWRHDAIMADIAWRHDAIMERLSDCFPKFASSPELQGEILAVLRMLEPKKAAGYKKFRSGSAGDGGYVQIDDIAGISHAFSFGVADNDSWDLAMAKAGIPVEQFDPAIEKAPSDHPLLRFHCKMLSADASAEAVTLDDLAAEYSKSGAPDLIVKCDIEGCEWDVLDRADDVLARFAQLICEFHDLQRLTDPTLSFHVARRRAICNPSEAKRGFQA